MTCMKEHNIYNCNVHEVVISKFIDNLVKKKRQFTDKQLMIKEVDELKVKKY